MHLTISFLPMAVRISESKIYLPDGCEAWVLWRIGPPKFLQLLQQDGLFHQDPDHSAHRYRHMTTSQPEMCVLEIMSASGRMRREVFALHTARHRWTIPASHLFGKIHGGILLWLQFLMQLHCSSRAAQKWTDATATPSAPFFNHTGAAGSSLSWLICSQ